MATFVVALVVLNEMLRIDNWLGHSTLHRFTRNWQDTAATVCIDRRRNSWLWLIDVIECIAHCIGTLLRLVARTSTGTEDDGADGEVEAIEDEDPLPSPPARISQHAPYLCPGW